MPQEKYQNTNDSNRIMTQIISNTAAGLIKPKISAHLARLYRCRLEENRMIEAVSGRFTIMFRKHD